MLSTVKIAGVASLLTIFGLGTANAADPLVPPAPAPNANTIQLKISGQVNRAILYGDNGPNEEIFYTDNVNSNTRFRFVASGRLNDDVTAGANLEIAFSSNSSGAIRFGANGGTSAAATERLAEVWLNSASMGKLSLGQGNTASNGTNEVDLSGTGLSSYSAAAGGQGGLTFAGTGTPVIFGTPIVAVGGLPALNADGTPVFVGGTAAVPNTTVSANFTNLDGGSRQDRIRYDTPTFAGFRLSASASQGGRNDVALRYANQFAGARIAAAIGYQNSNAISSTTNAEKDRVSGSISVLLDNGFNLTFAAGNANRQGSGNSDRKFFYGKVGFQTNSVSMYGRTSFSIDYYQSENLASTVSGTGKAYGIAAVQNLDPIGAQMYVSVKNFELDSASRDVFAVFTGMRIKF